MPKLHKGPDPAERIPKQKPKQKTARPAPAQPSGTPTWSQSGTPGFQAQLGRYQQLKSGGNEARITDWLKSRGGKSGEARLAFEQASTPPPPPAPHPAPQPPPPPSPEKDRRFVGPPEKVAPPPGIYNQAVMPPGYVDPGRGGPMPPVATGAAAATQGLQAALPGAMAGAASGSGAVAGAAPGLGMPSQPGMGGFPMGPPPPGARTADRAGLLGHRQPPPLESALQGLMAARGRVY